MHVFHWRLLVLLILKYNRRIEYYHLHEKDKHLWSSFLQKTGNEVKFRFGSTRKKYI